MEFLDRLFGRKKKKKDADSCVFTDSNSSITDNAKTSEGNATPTESHSTASSTDSFGGDGGGDSGGD